MSANKKKNIDAMEEVCDSDSSSDDERHPDAYSGSEEVQVDFEGRAPTDPDCHGISQLLSRLFLKAHINTMQLAEIIIAQNFVGSVIAQCDADGMEDSDADDDICEDGTIFGITTVLNITAKKDKPCIEQLKSYILERAEMHAPDAVKTDFKSLFDDDSKCVGFFINERFINIPAQISVPLMENLNKEIDAAKERGMKFDFTHFIMIVKLFRSKSRKGKPAEDTVTNAEEAVICKYALNSFEYSVADECDMGLGGDWLEGDPALTPYRKIVILDAKSLPTIIHDIKIFVDDQ